MREFHKEESSGGGWKTACRARQGSQEGVPMVPWASPFPAGFSSQHLSEGPGPGDFPMKGPQTQLKTEGRLQGQVTLPLSEP